MKLERNVGDDQRLLAAPLPCQHTYTTPLDDLERFVETLLGPFEVSKASVWIETVVFKPKDLIWYLRGAGIHTNHDELIDSLLIANDKTEAATLLECLLGQWVDFAFIPAPQSFVIYADHDQFTTVFTKSNEALNILQKHMRAEGFKEVQNWTWTGPRNRENKSS